MDKLMENYALGGDEVIGFERDIFGGQANIPFVLQVPPIRVIKFAAVGGVESLQLNVNYA
jgi:hypothetical protein